MAEIFVTAYVRTRPEILSECGDTVEQAVQFGLMVGFAEGMEWIIKEMPIGDE
jgi:xanthine dehydrogenase molybdopterin-binding subunit B